VGARSPQSAQYRSTEASTRDIYCEGLFESCVLRACLKHPRYSCNAVGGGGGDGGDGGDGRASRIKRGHEQDAHLRG
jgi:hypothetical protein